MTDINISVEIHPVGPNRIKRDQPKYRIYVNDELITERTWIWNKLAYIEEKLIVDLSNNVNHSIRVETIKNDPTHISRFILQNLICNNITKSNHLEELSELSFTLE
jgi:hypothetical protein